MLQDAGPDGLTLQQLCSSLSATNDKAEELLAALMQFGLIRRIGGYLTWSYVASEHSSRFLTGDGQVSCRGFPNHDVDEMPQSHAVQQVP